VDTIGERLREERLRNGWSQKDLARESKINVDTISGIETGQHEPRPSTLTKLAKALSIEVRDLFEEPALSGKVEAPAPGPTDKETPIFDVVHDAVRRQDQQNWQAINRLKESKENQVSHVRPENEALDRLLKYPIGDVADAYIDLMRNYVQLEHDNEMLRDRLQERERTHS
jgi:transcriptional regulator with XRE-family HTH domain